MVSFTSLQDQIEDNRKLGTQTKSLMNKISDLVEKIEMKYQRNKDSFGELEDYENVFYKGLIL